MSGQAVCTAHEGRHVVYLGACVALGREVPRPFVFRAAVCDECGAELDVRFDHGRRRAVRLLAGTNTPHGHGRPSVALDADELASAIVAASRAVRSERHPAPSPSPARHGRPSTATKESPPSTVESGIQTVTVWEPGSEGSGA